MNYMGESEPTKLTPEEMVKALQEEIAPIDSLKPDNEKKQEMMKERIKQSQRSELDE